MVKKDFNYFFLKGNKYFFRSCKEMETIFYHYAENHVEELKFRNECVVSGNEFNEFILRKFDYNLGMLWSSIFVTLMANKIGGLQFGIYRNCQISSRVFHTAVAALPLTKANRSDFE